MVKSNHSLERCMGVAEVEEEEEGHSDWKERLVEFALPLEKVLSSYADDNVGDDMTDVLWVVGFYDVLQEAPRHPDQF